MPERRLWDISPPVHAGSPVFPGDTPYRADWNARIGPGCPVNLQTLTLSPHVGAHADAPLHYDPAGAAIGLVGLEPYLGRCRVIHAIGAAPVVAREHVAHALAELPPRVLLRTYERAPVGRWDPALAGVAPELLEELADRGVRLVGIDSASVDPADSKALDAHQVLRRRGLRVLENLVLDAVAEGDYELIALPLKLVEADASPVRAILRELEMTRDDALALDAADPLAPLRELFELPPGLIYLDGNSLGALPRATPARVAEVVQREWGRGLIGSWNDAGWIGLPQRVGDKIARLVGARPGELVVADSSSVNLYKVLAAALTLARADAPQRTRIVSERGNFPTDLYIAESLAAERGCELVLVDAPQQIPAALDERCALLMLTQVDYRTGRLHDMAALSAAAHAVGALAVWDLAHSAGALPVDLHAAGADYAVGCGYKYLNGGPGAPAFVWVHPRHVERFAQPLSGWMGHAAPFEFRPGYRPAPGVARYLCGTPPVVSMAALECGVDTLLAAEPLGGLPALRAKSLALTRLFAGEVRARCPQLAVVSPEADAERGSQVSLVPRDDPASAWPLMQALIADGVVGDFRAPDILRFGFTPLYTRHVDAWDAAQRLAALLASGAWRDPRFTARRAVT